MTWRWAIRVLAMCLLAFSLLPYSNAHAVDGRVRASLGDNNQIWVGQRVLLNVDLLTTGFSFSEQRFTLPEISGALLLESGGTTIKLTERLDGETWQILRYEFSLFPQRTGNLEVPPISVSFTTSEGFGKEPTVFESQTNPLQLEIATPPGVSPTEHIITTSDFNLQVSVDPSATEFTVGDALTRQVMRQAVDISGMAFPPLPTPRIDGVASYPKEPDVSDRSERGELIGTRTESTTFVLQQSGPVTIPGATLTWWDPTQQTLHTETIPELNLEVAPNAALQPTAVPASQQAWQFINQYPRVLVGALSVISGFIFLCWRFGRQWREQWRAWRIRKRKVEKALYQLLIKACKRNDPKNAFKAFVEWRTALTNMAQQQGALSTFKTNLRADETLSGEWVTLQQALVQSDATWSGIPLSLALNNFRTMTLASFQSIQQNALPPLNPTQI